MLRTTLILFAALIFAGQASADERPLRRAIPAELDTLDPHRATLKWTWDVLRDVHEGLTSADAMGRTIPGAAESWSVSADGLTYTFRLRKGLRWSDGAPLEADDFVAGLRRLYHPATASKAASLLYAIKSARAVNAGNAPPEALGVAALGSHDVEITLEHPLPALPTLLALPFTAPAPRHRDADEAWYEAGTGVASGAYRLAAWTPGDKIVLQKNPNYRDAGAITLPEVHYLPVRNESQALRRFRAGELDMVSWLSGANARWVDTHLPDASRRDPALFVTYLVFNTRHPPFDDLDVREALSIAIDRNTLAHSVLGLGDRPATGFAPQGLSDYPHPDPPFVSEATDAQKTRARKLLEAKGWTPDAPLSLTFRVRASEDDKRVALAIRQMWSEIGVTATLLSADLKTHYAALEAGNFEVADAGWSSFDGPEFFLDLFLSDTGGLNYGSYANPAYDGLVMAAQRTADLTRRNARFAEAEQLLLTDSAVAPLLFNVSRYLIGPPLRGFEGNAPDIHLSRYLSLSGQ